MAKKTWKIGEYCRGGVITTEVKGTKIIVIAKEWDFSAGSKKSSNQSNAKEFDRHEVDIINLSYMVECEIENFLNDLTTSYYAGQIMDWIKSKFYVDDSLNTGV